MPRGTFSVFTRAFRAKRELHCIFLGKKAIITTSKHGTTIFSSYYNFFSRKTYRTICPKSARKYRYRIVLMPPGHPIILLKYGRRIGKKVSCWFAGDVTAAMLVAKDKNVSLRWVLNSFSCKFSIFFYY